MKKINLIFSVLVAFLVLFGCDNNPAEVKEKDPDGVLGGEEIEAYVFFSTDIHSAVNTPAFTEVWVDDKMIGNLTSSIVPETVLLDSIRQCDPEKSYPYFVKYKVEQPKYIKYQFIVKSSTSKDIIKALTPMELHIDKSGNYNAFHITYKGEGE